MGCKRCGVKVGVGDSGWVTIRVLWGDTTRAWNLCPACGAAFREENGI